MPVFLVLLLGPGLTVANDENDPAVIELGELAVTRKELNDRFEVAVRILAGQQGISLSEQSPAVIERLRVQYLDKRATELVMLQEAARREIAVATEDVGASVSEFLRTVGGGDILFEELREAGIDGEKLLRRIVRDEKVVQMLTEQLLQEIVIPPGDVVTLHHDIKHTLITPEEVCVRHIQTASAETAQQILAELEHSPDFARLATERSTDAESAGDGGDLGCFEKGDEEAASEFRKAVFAAEKDSIAGPVRSGFGYHVIQVYERKPSHETTLNEAYDDIERELKHEQLPKRINTLISESGIKTYPEDFVASDAGD
jgi:parvulin-like peptidyl-prolyl isomerase